jgi:hypothetical protein
MTEATPAQMADLMLSAHQAARNGQHGQCRRHLGRLEAWSSDGEIDSGIAALYLLIGDAVSSRRLLKRAESRGSRHSVALGVETLLSCADGDHARSRATAMRWMDAAEQSPRTVEDLLVEDAPGFRLPPAHSRDWHESQKLLAAGRLRESLASMDRGNDRAAPFVVGARQLRTRHGFVPRWDGDRVSHLLVTCPDGHGDAFFAWRYVRALQGRVDRVSFIATKAATALLAGTVPGVDVYPLDASQAALRQATAYSDWWRLPGMLDSFACEPYIVQPEPMALPQHAGRTIGIVYGGSTANRDNALRSAPVADLADLFALPGIAWHSLMIDPGYVAELPAGVIDLSPRLRTFKDTAAAIAALDAVVTIDSSVANLAGAMGKPVLMLVELDGDFRWFGPDGRSAWFPSARVFRQERAGEWGAAVASLADHVASGATMGDSQAD